MPFKRKTSETLVSTVAKSSWRLALDRARVGRRHGLGPDLAASAGFLLIAGTLASLVDARGVFYGGHQLIADSATVTTRTVRKMLARAVRAGVLARTRRGGGWGPRRMSEYVLAWPGGPDALEAFLAATSPRALDPTRPTKTPRPQRPGLLRQLVEHAGRPARPARAPWRPEHTGPIDPARVLEHVRTDLRTHLGGAVDDAHLLAVVTTILERASGPLRDPGAYVLTSVAKNPAPFRPTPTPPRAGQVPCATHGRPGTLLACQACHDAAAPRPPETRRTGRT